jgi:hypothetical protein
MANFGFYFLKKCALGGLHSPLYITTKWKTFNQKIIDHGLWKVHLLLYTWAYPREQNSSREPTKSHLKH